MHQAGRWRPVVALAAVALLAAACGSEDDDEGASASGSASAVEDSAPTTDDEPTAPGSSVEIELVDFGYAVSGPIGTGVQSFTTTNTGDEIHMMGIGKLKEGASIEEFAAALQAQGEEGGAEEAEGDDPEGEGGGGDPFAEFIDGEVGTPGHILLPGATQTITIEDDLDVGTYALICFIPGEGDGVPHFAKGMVNELEVVEEGGSSEAPEADAEYSLADDAPPSGPAELAAGEVTLELTNDGEIGKDFVVASVDEGHVFEDFDTYFVEIFEGEEPPPAGAADQVPGIIAGNTFEIPPGQTIYLTVELTPGTWQLVNTVNHDGDAGASGEDLILEVTVS